LVHLPVIRWIPRDKIFDLSDLKCIELNSVDLGVWKRK
jgi:hypothetical protein